MQGRWEFSSNKTKAFLLLSAVALAIVAVTVLIYTQIVAAGFGQYFFYVGLYFIISMIMGSSAVACVSYRRSHGRLRQSLIHGIVAGFAMSFAIGVILVNRYGS
ncbi:hypothetical protein [Leminorella grimontii]|uniref:hypothetical protein n=1 Tax=Leminorella grimontii TaxID=82981 RepID=UPI0032207D33